MSRSFNGAARVAPYNIKRAIENYEADSKAWKQHEEMLRERFIASFRDGVWRTQREKAQAWVHKDLLNVARYDHTPAIMAKRVGEDITRYSPYISGRGEVVWEKEYYGVKALAAPLDGHSMMARDIYLTPSQMKWVSIWQERHIEDLEVRQAYSESFYSRCIHGDLEWEWAGAHQSKSIYLKERSDLVAVQLTTLGGDIVILDEGALSPLQSWRVKRRIKKFLKENK